MNRPLNTNQNHVIALAGVFQSCALVKNIACEGTANPEAVQTSLLSTLQLESNSVETIFGDSKHIEVGLKTLQKQLGNHSKPEIDITQYAVSLLYLEKKLRRNSQMMDFIGSELKQVKNQLKHFDILHPNIIARLADIYQQSVSQLGPKIMVKGEQSFLDNPNNANKIRALLLAGIRAAVLFRQCKGSKFKLLLRRKQYLKIIEHLVNT